MIGPIECLVCGKPCVGLDGITAHRCDNLREQGWQVSAAHDEAVCPDCVRDVHEDTEESPAAPSFLTWRQLRDAVRVSGDEHTHEPESETGNVPGVVAHLASTLKNLDSQEAARPIAELDEQLVGDSVGGHQWQGEDTGVHLVDGEPVSFQDADDDTWHRQEDGSYRMPGPMGNYHHQPSLRAAVDYAGLQPDESLVLDALQRERDVLEHKRHAEKQQARIHELEGQNIEMARRSEEQYVEMDEQDDRVRALQNEIARVVAERNELQETVQSKLDQLDEVRRMYSNAVERITFLEEALKTTEKIHRPYERDGRIECEACGGSGECLTHAEAGAAYDCGRAFPSGDVLLSQLRCVRSKSHLGLHRDTAEKADARYEWDDDGNLM